MRHVNLFGPINMSGYGIHFTNWAATVMAEAASRKVGVCVVPKGPIGIPRGVELMPNERAIIHAVQMPELFQPHATSICLWHMQDIASYAGSKRFQFTVFETTKLRPAEERLLKKVDGLIVPTDWHAEMLKKHYAIDAVVIPEGVDGRTFYYGDTGMRTRFVSSQGAGVMMREPHEYHNREETIFVSVGKLEKRKGMSVAMDALKMTAASTNRKIRLLAHWWNPFLDDYEAERDLFMQKKGFTQINETITGQFEIAGVARFLNPTLPNVIVDILTHPLRSQRELVDVYRTGHFGLFPFFAEGWCLPLHESMACGLPPICQGYSGPSQYLVPGAYLPVMGEMAVAFDGLPAMGGQPAKPKFFYGDSGEWSQTNTNILSSAMLTALDMREEERVAMGKKASEAALEWTWEKSAKITLNFLEERELL